MKLPAKQLSDFNGIRDQIVKLRCMGHSQHAISKMLGLNYKKVKELLDSEFKERFENREELRLQTAAQYDFLIRPLLEKFDRTVDRKDAETIAKLLDNKARLLGLNEAVKVSVKHDMEALSDEDLEKELAKYNVVKQVLPALPEAAPSSDVIDADFNLVDDLAEVVEESAHIDTDNSNGTIGISPST